MVADDVAAARVLGVVRDAAGELLADGRGSTSTAARRSARAGSRWRSRSSSAPADRTLTDDEVAERREAIAAALAADLGATLRG